MDPVTSFAFSIRVLVTMYLLFLKISVPICFCNEKIGVKSRTWSLKKADYCRILRECKPHCPKNSDRKSKSGCLVRFQETEIILIFFLFIKYISRGFLQRQKRIVIYYVKMFVKESQQWKQINSVFLENWHFISDFVLKTTKTTMFVFFTEILCRTFWHYKW